MCTARLGCPSCFLHHGQSLLRREYVLSDSRTACWYVQRFFCLWTCAHTDKYRCVHVCVIVLVGHHAFMRCSLPRRRWCTERRSKPDSKRKPERHFLCFSWQSAHTPRCLSSVRRYAARTPRISILQTCSVRCSGHVLTLGKREYVLPGRQ